MEHTVTTIEEISGYQKGQVVQLPDFAEGQPFYARLRRPSILALVKSGKIPNGLLTTANKLFSGKGVEDNNKNYLSDVLGVFDVLCEATFVEPTWQDMKTARVELTDEQYLAVFQYTQRGVQALETFRKQSADNGDSVNVSNVQMQAVRNSTP